jgi:hypothetical protein
MKEEIIQALNFPRVFIHDAIDDEACPHNGHFAHNDPGCQHCTVMEDCSWLSRNDACVSLTKKPVEVLASELEFAMDYIQAQLSYWYHNPATCSCSACSWLRNAQSVYDQFNDRVRI